MNISDSFTLEVFSYMFLKLHISDINISTYFYIYFYMLLFNKSFQSLVPRNSSGYLSHSSVSQEFRSGLARCFCSWLLRKFPSGASWGAVAWGLDWSGGGGGGVAVVMADWCDWSWLATGTSPHVCLSVFLTRQLAFPRVSDVGEDGRNGVSLVAQPWS